MTPITKNITVLDNQGNNCGTTYLKRAKGLIRSGRARFLDDDTICITCPPVAMEDNIVTDYTEEMADIQKQTVSCDSNNCTCSETGNLDQPMELTMSYVLNRIDYIMKQNNDIHKIVETIHEMQSDKDTAVILADTIKKTVECRENTYQQMLKLFEKMYDDLKPNNHQDSEELKKYQMLIQMVKESNLTPEDRSEVIKEISYINTYKRSDSQV